MSYAILKLVHIVSATVLFGTGLGSAFYMWRAYRVGDVRVIAVTARNVVLADWVFTTPAVIVQPVTGYAMMQVAGYSWSQLWLSGALVLYLVAGACWLPVVWLQIRMRTLAALAQSAETLPDEFHRRMRLWWWLGWPAFVAVLGAFYLMVMKPGG